MPKYDGQIQDLVFVKNLFIKYLTSSSIPVPMPLAQAIANILLQFMQTHALQFIFIPRKANDNEPAKPE